MAASDDPREVREERRVITAVFADLVGSTSLGERLDPEELKLIVGDAVARVIDAVESFGGTIKDLAGDGVLALFGAPTAHEDDPERAVRASLRIVEEIADYAQEVEDAWGVGGFGVRVGVQTGPVVVGAIGAGGRVEYAALGDAVNTAARLQSAAGPAEVLVGEATMRLVEPMFDWGEPTELQLKGKSAPVVARVAQAATGVRAGMRGLEGVEARLIGRERELDEGRRAVAGALAGTGGILFVTGEPGIGKTRLVAELRDLFEAGTPQHGRALWLEGRCVSYGETMPYWPFRDLLRSWIGVLADEPELRVRVALRRMAERLFGARAGEISPYLAALLGLTLEPDAAKRLAELSPEALQYRTFEVVREVIARLAEAGPLAVVLEDLHWADATSLQLLERLFGDTEGTALLLVLTSRLERDHPWWRAKEDAARQLPHRITDVTLEALSGDAGRELLHALVGEGTLPADVERRILEPAEGNPFFLEELIRSLVDAGAVTHDEDGWRFVHDVPLEVPPTVEKVILARIDRLDAGARDALVAASVLGRQFGLPLLEAVVEGEDGAVRQSLLDLMRLDLVREGRRWPEPEYRFKHALIQEAAYRTLVTADRNRLHREAATWLEARYEGREEEVAGLLAHHWLAADDEDKAVTYLTIAGDRARQEYALDEAIGHYRELLPILERQGEGREIALVLFKLALALHMSLRFKEANETYQRAFPFWTPPEPFPDEPTATVRVATSYRPRVNDPRAAIAWPDIQLCMQLFDRSGRAVAGTHDRSVARGSVGDRGRRPAVRVPSAGRARMVRRDAAHGGRYRVRHQARPGSRRAGIVRRDLLRARERAGLLPGPQRGRGSRRRHGVGRSHGRVPAGRAGSLLHERHEPARRRSAAATCDRGGGCVLDRRGSAGRERCVPDRRADGRSARARTAAERRRFAGRQYPAGRVRPLVGGRRRRPTGARRSRHRDGPVHAEARGRGAFRPRRRTCRTGRLVGVLRLRPRAPRAVERGLPPRPGARGRSGDPGEPGPGQRGGGDRRRRSARAPGPHAGHRPAVRSGQGSRVPRGERRPRAERDDRGDRDVGDAVPRGRGGHVERGPRASTSGWSRGRSSER